MLGTSAQTPGPLLQAHWAVCMNIICIVCKGIWIQSWIWGAVLAGCKQFVNSSPWCALFTVEYEHEWAHVGGARDSSVCIWVYTECQGRCLCLGVGVEGCVWVGV